MTSYGAPLPYHREMAAPPHVDGYRRSSRFKAVHGAIKQRLNPFFRRIKV